MQGVRRTLQAASDVCAGSRAQLAVIYDQPTHDAIYNLTGNAIFKKSSIFKISDSQPFFIQVLIKKGCGFVPGVKFN